MVKNIKKKKITSKISSKVISQNPMGFLKKITISKIAKITKQTLVNNYENFIEKQKNKKLEEIENAKIKRAERIQLEILKEERAHQQKLIDQEDIRLENQRIKLNIEKQQQKIEEQKVKEQKQLKLIEAKKKREEKEKIKKNEELRLKDEMEKVGLLIKLIKLLGTLLVIIVKTDRINYLVLV